MNVLRKIARFGAWFLGVVILTSAVFIARVYHQGSLSDVQTADTIIVLGAAQWNNEPSPMFRARLDRARELYAQEYAESIIVTGGRAPGAAASDSSVGKAYLVRLGIATDRIYIEERSRTTLQNLIHAHEIMEAQSFRSALLVSHDFHIMRAGRMAHDLDAIVFPAPVQTENPVIKLRYAMRELLLYPVYLLLHK